MIRSTCLAALCAAPAALAEPWDGTYRLGAGADCGRVGEEGGALRIGEGVLEGVGARCRMTEPVDVIGMDATLYVMACEGPGEEGGDEGAEAWSERAMFLRAAEGDAILVVWNGYAFRYDRCPEPAPPGEEGAAAGALHGAPGGGAAGRAEDPEAAP